MAIITLEGLAGKRVKKFLRAQAAEVAAAQAQAATASATEAEKARAVQLAAEQLATHQSYMAKQATKSRGIKGVIQKAKDIRLKIDPVARTQAFVETARKEGIEVAKDELKSDYVKGPMRLMSKISPSMKEHYEHQTRRVEMRDLKTQLDQTTDPVKRAQLEARMQVLQKREEKYAKQGAIVRTVVSIIVAVVPILAFLAPFISAANAAVSVAEGKKQYDAAKRAKREGERQEEEAIQHMMANGMTRDQAQRVIQLLKNGVPAEAALKSVLVGAPAPAAVSQEWKPMKMQSPEAAQAAFLQWLQGWNPEVYDAVMAKMDKETSLAGYAVDYDTGMFEYRLDGMHGLGFWASIGSAVTNISNTAGTLLKTYYDKKLMDIQLKQLKMQQAPMPTPVAEKAVEAQVQAQAQAQGSGGGMPSWVLPAAGIGLVGLLLMRRR